MSAGSVSVRVLTTGLGVAGFAVVLVDNVVLLPLLGRVGSPWLALALALSSLLLTVVGPPLLFLGVTRRLRHRPASFDLHPDGASFAMPTSLRYLGFAAVLAMVAAGLAAPTDAVVAVVLACGAVAYIWLFRYSVTFTPVGVVVRVLWSKREMLWSELLAGGPLPPSRFAWVMLLRYQRPGGRPTKVLCLAVSFLHVDRVFLASVIRHYAEQPDHRPSIGTRAELERLEAGFTAWRATLSQQPGQSTRTTMASRT